MLNESDFLKDDQPRKWRVTFAVEGEIEVTVDAGSKEEAEEAADELMADEDFGLELDEVLSVRVGRLWKEKPLFLVSREGQTMRVSRLKDGDMPREPTETGF
jgi:hypothetical protein